MSGDKKATDQAEDPELQELLNSALKDFDKPIIPPTAAKKDDAPVSSVPVEEPVEDYLAMEDVWTEDFIKQAADHFQQNLEELLENGDDGKIAESFKKIAQTVAGAMSEDGLAESSIPNFQSAINQALKDLSETSENLQNMPNIVEADLAAMFQQASLEDGVADLPFVHGMMQSLLTKEVLYPSTKELIDKLPVWLEEKRSTLSATDLAKYEKQLSIMRKVFRELESEKENDSEEVKKKRYEVLLELMQEAQSCGKLPDDLYGENFSF